MALGHEFDPSDGSIGFSTLCGRNERDEPVPIEEPARTEGLKTKVLHGHQEKGHALPRCYQE